MINFRFFFEANYYLPMEQSNLIKLLMYWSLLNTRRFLFSLDMAKPLDASLTGDLNDMKSIDFELRLWLRPICKDE